jgi:hypothetical protein
LGGFERYRDVTPIDSLALRRVALAITAHQDVTFLTDRTRFICVYISAFAFYYQLLAGL